MKNQNLQRLNSTQMRRDAAEDHLRIGFKLTMALGCVLLFSVLVAVDPIEMLVDWVIASEAR